MARETETLAKEATGTLYCLIDAHANTRVTMLLDGPGRRAATDARN